MVVAAVSGTAGVGKTALAIHWAHRVAGRFPDGQLYVNLRGFDPGGRPADPSRVLHGFLRALGLPPSRIPVDLEGRAAAYRSLLTGRRVLVVLDNARDAEQVRPLLPGSAGCFALITSRDRLTPLIATEGAVTVPLDLMSTADSWSCLAVGSAPTGSRPSRRRSPTSSGGAPACRWPSSSSPPGPPAGPWLRWPTPPRSWAAAPARWTPCTAVTR